MNAVKILLIIMFFLFSTCSVYAAETWESGSFGGSAEVTEPSGPNTTWHSTSFGGSAAVMGWDNWSAWWNITQVQIAAPTSFSVSNYNSSCLNVSWTRDTNADSTTITRKKDSMPTSPSDGDIVYNDTGSYFNDTGLDVGTNYSYKTWSWNTTYGYSSGNSSGYAYTSPGDLSNFVNSSIGYTWMNFTWTNGTNASNYIIRYSDHSYPLTPQSNESGYNGSGPSCQVSGLLENTTYYVRIWGWVNPFSEGNSSMIVTTLDASGDVDPPYNGSSDYIPTSPYYLNLSWDRGNNSDSDWVVKKTTGYPSNYADGTMVDNNTANSSGGRYYYNESGVVSFAYYTIFSWNSSNNTFSVTGEDIPWGAMVIWDCFNESNMSESINYDIEITDENASEVYTQSSVSDPLYLDINDIPYGDNTVFLISNASYKQRVYYYDLELNNFYNFTFYLPPHSTPGDEGDCERRSIIDIESVVDPDVDLNISTTFDIDEIIGIGVYNISGSYGEWVSVANSNYTQIGTGNVEISSDVLDDNTTLGRVQYYYCHYENITDTQLYLLTVVGPQNEYTSPPVEGAKIEIRRYNNVSDSYITVTTVVTDANGQVEVYLVPFNLYKVTVSKSGYDTTVSEYIPGTDIYTKTFRITPTIIEPPVYDIFWDDISFNGTMYLNESIRIVYSDSNSSTVNTTLRLYDVFNGSFSLFDTFNNTNQSFTHWVTSINTSRPYEAWLWFNNSASYAVVTSPISITILPVNGSWGTPFDLDARFTNVFGSFELGYANFFAILIPLIMLMVLGPFNVGGGIFACGLALGLMQILYAVWVTSAFNPLLAVLCPLCLVFGFMYIRIKGDDHL